MGLWGIALGLVLSGALDTNEAFQEGVNLYQELEFEQAIFRFESAALAPDLSDQERAMVFGWMAMSYAGIGNVQGARRSLTNALNKDPTMTLPAFAPPKVKTWLEELRTKAPPPPPKQPAQAQAESKAQAEQTAPAQEPDTTTSAQAEQPARKASSSAGASAPTERTESFMVTPEEPEEDSSSALSGVLMMGAGAGSLVVAAVAAVPAAIFLFDGLFIVQPVLDDLGPNHPDYDAYQNAQTTDFIAGGSLAALGAVFALVGIGLVVIGGGSATYSLLE